MAEHRLLAALVVASVVAVDPGGWWPYGPAKQGVIIAGFAAMVALTRRYRVGPLGRLVSVGAGVFLGALALAALFGADPVMAWIGTPERRMGVVGWCTLAAAFVVGRRLGAVNVLRALTAGAAAFVLVGLFESMGVTAVDLDAGSGRLLGPYGSASYTGSAGVVFTAVLLLQAHRWHGKARFLALLGGLVSAALTIATSSRSAWVGLAVVAIGAGLMGARAGRARQRLGVVALALAGVAAAALLVPWGLAGQRASTALGSGGGLESRFDEWTIGLGIVADHPVLGVGPEGYRIAAVDHIGDAYAVAYGRDVTPDRAHNLVIDVAASVGLVGLIGWLVAVAGLLESIRRRWGMGPLLLVVAFPVAQLGLFPVVEIDPLWWLLLGGLTAANAESPNPSRVASPTQALMAFVCAGAAVVWACASCVEVVADRSAASALEADIAGHRLDAVDAAQRAVDLRPDVVRYHRVLARVATVAAVPSSWVQRIDQLESARRWAPDDPGLRVDIAVSWSYLATLVPDRAAEAVEVVDAALEADPSHPVLWFARARVALSAGAADTVASSINRALDLGGELPMDLLDSDGTR
ncbi:MAG: O-antigen ligase family protein [Acidimicrobiales bacterium]|nr:O-antigen ligase family protein [Acidimicrobiales bacterium]